MNAIAHSAEALAAILLNFLMIPPPDIPEDTTQTPTIKPEARESHQQAADAVAEDPNFWSAPFVLADRQNREVIVWGETTGMVLGDPVEFFVIHERSGQDYEALMVTFAKPSDIHQALEFIDLSPIGPVDPDQHRFWPRGDQVNASFHITLPGDDEPRSIPAHQWITHPDGSVMAPLPWVFTGSPIMPSLDDPDQTVYAADVYSPNSVASTFNLRNTVFDLPKQGAKTAVYGHYNRNPAIDTAQASPILLRLSPTEENDFPPERDLTLHLAGQPPSFTLEGLDPDPSFDSLDELESFLQDHQDEILYLTIHIGPNVPLSQLALIAEHLEILDAQLDPLRIDPPPEGQLYYQAFSPPKRFRQRARRPSQPLELHLRRDPNGSLRATLKELDETWEQDQREPDIVETPHSMDSPRDWFEYLEEHPPRIQVLFLYAPENTTHADLAEWMSPIAADFPVIYIYPESE